MQCRGTSGILEGKMKNNKTLVLCILIFAVIAVFAVITITVTSTTLSSEETAAESVVGSEEKDASSDTDSPTGKADRDTAESLIGQDLSRDQVKEKLGEWNDFNMDGNGCERGVYAGRFYYDDFILYSRTYDLGKTFRIMSVNDQE